MDLKSTVLETFVTHIVPLIATIIASIGGWALKKLADKWGAEAKESKLSALGARLVSLTATTVHEIEATMRLQYKAAAADGRITPEEGRLLKQAALDQLKASLGAHGLVELKAVLGLGTEALPGFLGGLIERQVASIKTLPAPVALTLTAPVASPLEGAPGGLPSPR